MIFRLTPPVAYLKSLPSSAPPSHFVVCMALLQSFSCATYISSWIYYPDALLFHSVGLRSLSNLSPDVIVEESWVASVYSYSKIFFVIPRLRSCDDSYASMCLHVSYCPSPCLRSWLCTCLHDHFKSQCMLHPFGTKLLGQVRGRNPFCTPVSGLY